MKLLSLFDGSGAFPLSAERHGIEARYASEIEPFPIAVTRARFHNMEHLGDITEIDGGMIEPCDIVTFGSPCVGLSIAGKGGGLADERSGLFHEAIRVMREMLSAANGDFPRYFIFENVPNLLSIHSGADWKIVMDSFADLGFICDPNILDSQEFCVAQRRKRIFIAGINKKYYNPADFADVPNNRNKRMQKAIDIWGGETFHGITSRPHEIHRKKLSEILERSVDPRYYLTPTACLGILRRVDAKGKEIPQLLRSALEFQAGLFNCTPAEGECTSFEPGATARLPRAKCWDNISPTLRAHAGDNSVSIAYPIDLRNATRTDEENCGMGIGGDGDPAYTITAEQQHAIALEHYPNAGRIKIEEGDLCQTITGRAGTGGCSVPLLAEPVVYGICSQSSNAMCSKNPRSGVCEMETSRTLDTGACSGNGGQVVVEPKEPIYVLEGNGQRPSHNGNGISENVCYTLNCTEHHKVAYSMTTGSYAQVCEESSPTLMARDFKDPPITNCPAYGIDRAAYNQGANAAYKPQIAEESTHSPAASGQGAASVLSQGLPAPSYIVRRLTPTECLVLMNLPSEWCDNIGIDDPTEDDYLFWEDVFKTLGKKKSRKQIAKWLKNPKVDGHIYKIAGNGCVVAVVDFVMRGIAAHTSNSPIKGPLPLDLS